MKLLITGATGSLGAYLTRYFSGKGHQVIASGKAQQPPKNLLNCAQYFQADINRPFELPETDVVIHTAALSDDNAKPHELLKSNAQGTTNVLQAAERCQRFIHISSSSVYVPDEKLITEEMAGPRNNMQLSPYGKSKLESELVVRNASRHNACFILRPRALYGIGDKKILPRLLKMVKGSTLQYPGNLQVNVSMTEYSNMAYAVELCINSEKQGIHTYNVADNEAYVLLQVIRTFTKHFYGFELNEKQIPIWIPKLMAVFHIGGISPLLIRSLTKNMVLDITKIKQELGYNPQANLANSVYEIANWVQKIGGPEVLAAAEKRLAWA